MERFVTARVTEVLQVEILRVALERAAVQAVVREHKIVLYLKIVPTHWFALPEHVKNRIRIRLVSMTPTVRETKLALRELAKNQRPVRPLRIARGT